MLARLDDELSVGAEHRFVAPQRVLVQFSDREVVKDLRGGEAEGGEVFSQARSGGFRGGENGGKPPDNLRCLLEFVLRACRGI